MRWVVEDYGALARLIDGANRWGRDETALAPGRLILRLRRGLQVSQLQLAKRAGVPRSLVGRVESGGDVQIGSLRRLLGALGCGLVILPASAGLLAQFKAKAKEKRRRDREWERARQRLETRPAQAK
jgi:transcriptional regulator with XRE-family HTH domain